MRPITVVFLFSLSFLITSCVFDVRMPPPKAELPCKVILYSPFPDFVGTALEVDRALDLIETNWGIERSDVHIGTSGDITSASWQTDGIEHMLVWTGGTLRKITVVFDERAPTIGKIAECIGSHPQWYQALQYSHIENRSLGFSLQLWFPPQGIVTRTYGFVSGVDALPRIDPELTANDISIVLPGSPEEMFAEIEWGVRPPDEPPIKPWPGSWDRIQFEQ